MRHRYCRLPTAARGLLKFLILHPHNPAGRVAVPILVANAKRDGGFTHPISHPIQCRGVVLGGERPTQNQWFRDYFGHRNTPARDSKSRGIHFSCGFDPHLQHQENTLVDSLTGGFGALFCRLDCTFFCAYFFQLLALFLEEFVHLICGRMQVLARRDPIATEY